jgi:hypothetical protein
MSLQFMLGQSDSAHLDSSKAALASTSPLKPLAELLGTSMTSFPLDQHTRNLSTVAYCYKTSTNNHLLNKIEETDDDGARHHSPKETQMGIISPSAKQF